jgi:hypothetical protein
MAEVTSGVNIDTVLVLTKIEAETLGRLVARRADNHQWWTDILEKHEQYALDRVAEALGVLHVYEEKARWHDHWEDGASREFQGLREDDERLARQQEDLYG